MARFLGLAAWRRFAAGRCVVEFSFHNVNELDADGCECAVALDGESDEPDVFDSFPAANTIYKDRDCDGVDGDASRSLFVFAGTTSSQGTQEAPYATINEAITSTGSF